MAVSNEGKYFVHDRDGFFVPVLISPDFRQLDLGTRGGSARDVRIGNLDGALQLHLRIRIALEIVQRARQVDQAIGRNHLETVGGRVGHGGASPSRAPLTIDPPSP